MQCFRLLHYLLGDLETESVYDQGLCMLNYEW